MPFREWNFVFREWNFEFRELLREYPGTLPELREWPSHSESVFPEIMSPDAPPQYYGHHLGFWMARNKEAKKSKGKSTKTNETKKKWNFDARQKCMASNFFRLARLHTEIAPEFLIRHDKGFEEYAKKKRSEKTIRNAAKKLLAPLRRLKIFHWHFSKHVSLPKKMQKRNLPRRFALRTLRPATELRDGPTRNFHEYRKKYPRGPHSGTLRKYPESTETLLVFFGYFFGAFWGKFRCEFIPNPLGGPL